MTEPPERPAFVPVTLRARADGWTLDRQRAFLAKLAATGSVRAAAQAAGLSRASAYRLRARADAGAFADAWSAALVRPPCPRAALVRAQAQALWDRAYLGWTTPIVRGGVVVGARVRLDNAALLTLDRRFDHGGRQSATGDRARSPAENEKCVSQELRHLSTGVRPTGGGADSGGPNDGGPNGGGDAEHVGRHRVEPAFHTETIMTGKKGGRTAPRLSEGQGEA